MLVSVVAGSLACGTALVSLVSSGAAAQTAGTTGAPAPTGEVALTWAPTYMSNDHSYTQAEAEAVARRFDLVAGMPIAFQKYVSAMRAVNPDISLISYANGTLAEPTAVATLPEAAYAHDQYGRRIVASDFGTYLMESSNPAWRDTAVRQCDDRVARSGYDGCLVDMLTLGIYSKGYVTGLPVVPGTTTTYTQAQYRDQMVALGKYYREQSPALIHAGNAVENSYRYWQAATPSRPLARSLPAAQMEDFLRGSGTAVDKYPTAADWLRNVDVIRDLESAGVTALLTTKLWVSATDAQAAAWDRYAMASFLMGANGKSYYAFTRSRDKAGASGTNMPYRMPKEIGLPTGAMQQTASGAYLRRFDHGASVVNPTTSSVTVKLGGTYRSLDGQTVTQLTLPPNSGDVLVGEADPTPIVEPTPDPVPADTVAPVGTHGWRNVAPRQLNLGGAATDDRGVAAAFVSVRNESTLKWLRRDGTWGAFDLLPAKLAGPGLPSTTWSAAITLPAGRYGVSLTVADTTGNRNVNPRPWVVVSVPSA